MIRTSSKRCRRSGRRCGAVIVFVMIALLVATLLSAELIKMAGMSHRLIKRDEWAVQANRLAEAGCARALILIGRDPNFTEADWAISADQLPSGQAALVRIKIDTSNPGNEDRTILVVAEYPSNHPEIVRATREVRIPR